MMFKARMQHRCKLKCYFLCQNAADPAPVRLRVRKNLPDKRSFSFARIALE